MTQEEYKARRKEFTDKIYDNRRKETKELQSIEDDKRLAHSNAAEKIKAFTAKVEKEKLETLRYLNSVRQDIRRKYAEERTELDSEIKLLDAEMKHDYYVNLMEGNENDNPNF